MFPFHTKKIAIETLGEYLSHARVSRGLEYSHIRKLTQIPERYLKSLETGDFAGLPADVYVKGFLKSLSAIYGMDPESVLSQFERERLVQSNIAKNPVSHDGLTKKLFDRLVVTPRVITLLFVALGASVSIGYLIWQLSTVSAAPRLTLEYPLSDVQAQSRNVLVRGATESGARVFINSQEVAVDESGGFREVVSLLEGSNRLIVRSENKFGKHSEIERSIFVSTENSVLNHRPQSTRAMNIEIELHASAGTWVRALADGTIVLDRMVSSGEILNLSAQTEILLSCGDAGVTRIVYNGMDLGYLGRQGEALANIRFTAPTP